MVEALGEIIEFEPYTGPLSGPGACVSAPTWQWPVPSASAALELGGKWTFRMTGAHFHAHDLIDLFGIRVTGAFWTQYINELRVSKFVEEDLNT